MKRQKQKRLAAPKLSYKKTTDTILLFIAFFIDALIKIGSSLLWVFKKIQFVRSLTKRWKKFSKQIIGVILRAKREEKAKRLLRAKREVQSLQKLVRTSARTIKVYLRSAIKKIQLKPTLRKKVVIRKIIAPKGQIYPTPTPFLTKIKYFFLGTIATIIVIVWPLIFYFWLSELPNPKILSTRDISATTKIYDRNGTLLYQIYSGQNRTLVKLSDIPLNLKNATIAMEDKDFYSHHGINWRGIMRAALVNFRFGNFNGRPLQGGSSITQQLIKSALLNSEPTVTRKVKEVVLAIWAETIYSKEQILEMYFNQVPYGGTAWGVEAGAETYFHKKVSELNLAESSLLAGLPAAPTLFSPFGAHPELARERQKAVLRRMVEDGYIAPEQAELAQKEKLSLSQTPIEIKAPHFVMYVKELLVKKYGERTAEQGGLSVVTSLDLNIQEMVQKEVSSQVEQLKNLLVGNGAALVTNPKTGEILAMVGSKDYFDIERDGNVNVTLALRQPGSAIKPVMYAAALQHGFTPGSVIDDSPVVYKISGQPPYTPVNYDGKFHGKVTLRSALANSFNVPAVKALNSIGVSTMIEMGRKMGISTWEDESRYGLSLTLGGGEVTMLDMARAYGVLASGGKKRVLRPILKVTDYRGNVLEENTTNDGVQVMPAEIAFILSNILADNNARALAFGTNSALNIPNKTVSVKTGTTNDKRDNWTFGYTPSYLVAVWVGNNDNSPMHPYLTSGITGAAPIWHNIMTNLLTDKTNEVVGKSENVVAVSVCAWNGLLPCEGCPVITEYFVPGTEPKNHCEKITPPPSPTP